MYYIYHIIGKKIGVTNNPIYRLRVKQGYKKEDYEIIEKSKNLEYVSERELILQDQYGYGRDEVSYIETLNKRKKPKQKSKFKQVKNKNLMNINPTDQTSTFPSPLYGLKKLLLENQGMKWETIEGVFTLDRETIEWIDKNANVSRFNDSRSYIYNKALANFMKFKDDKPTEQIRDVEVKDAIHVKPTIFDHIRGWAAVRGIYDSGDMKTQLVKLQEEIGELARSILKEDKAEFIDAIGDCVVVLTNLSELGAVHYKDTHISIEKCTASAYDVISKRKGKMFNGTFIKETL